MATSKYSHAFLVGSFNGDLKPQDLERNEWKHKVLTHDEYTSRLSVYYQSHVDAMVEAEGQLKPDFLKDVHHYCVPYEETITNEDGYEVITKKGEQVSINFENDKKIVNFQFSLCNLHLYFFPLGIIIVAIEIDEEEGTDIDNLRLAHRLLINWEENINSIADAKLKYYLAPLAHLLPNKDLSTLVKDGNNLKIFQIVQTEDETPSDTLLFEIATFSPIGSVGKTDFYSHSKEYFQKIINENSVSTYWNWKALSLVDSFTVIAVKKFASWQWVNHYFPLIYLRCILEKTFCFSRNNEYRLGLSKMTRELSEEIKNMEKYYFYNNFSYNFQPNLVYDSMVKGLGIAKEREELSRQIKERTKEEEENRRNLITIGLSVFAIFSIAWDFCSIYKDAFNVNYLPAKIIFCTAFLIIFILAVLIFCKSAKWTEYKKKIMKCFALKWKEKNKTLVISIPSQVRSHLATHFLQDLPGSKFFCASPEELLDKATSLFPNEFCKAKSDNDGRIRISLDFPEEIGISNVVNINELTEEEKAKIEIIDRQGKMVRSVKTDRVIPTKECQIILSKDWKLITMFPGEMAPPLPDSPNIHDDYWDNHVFVE
jgi:hypothetical protein